MIQISCIKHTLKGIMFSHQKDDQNTKALCFNQHPEYEFLFESIFWLKHLSLKNPNPTRRVHPNLGEVFSTEFGPTKNAKVEHSST